MRKWLYILLCMLPLLSCSRETEPVYEEPLQEDGAPDGKALISFSVSLPESSASTKALGKESGLSTMYLAVFGSNGHYKEYVTATLISSGQENRTFHNVDGTTYTKTVDCYQFEAYIQLSNTPRTIHFLGNGPSPANIVIGDAPDVLPNLLCNDPNDASTGETAFWQMIYLPEIKAATNAAGEFLNPEGGVRQKNEAYMVSPETLAYFQNKRDDNGNLVRDGHNNAQGGIALIRNWAKIILRNNWMDQEADELGNYGYSNFEPKSFAVVNVPSRGTFVPYGGKTGFIGPDRSDPERKQYQEYGFDELFDPDGAFSYPGNLPEGTVFDTSIPDKDAFEYPEDPSKNPDGRVVVYDRTFDPTGKEPNPDYDPTSVSRADDEPAVYLYERPAPGKTLQPSYVIVYGRYYNPKDNTLTQEEKENGVWCFYKVDLMSDGQYYPIYRNFKYQIQIRKITSRGHDTPMDAAASAGSADVSADVTTSHLADISDGTRRMAVQPWISYTFIEGDVDAAYTYTYHYDDAEDEVIDVPGPAHLFVKFFDDITKTQPELNLNTASVTATVTPSGGGVIENDLVVVGHPILQSGSDYGWRPVFFKVGHPDAAVSRTQTIRLSCKTNPADANESALYRDIILTLQPKQTMKVTCRYPRILRYPKEDQYVDISIPDGLVESMFPLVFLVEPENMTLTPVNDESNLPVVYGNSVNPALGGKPRFQFERTLTWEQYNELHTEVNFADESRWKTFSCHFKTNCANSATTIWVSSDSKKDYFNPASDSFTDYFSFKDPMFKTSIPRKAGETVTVNFGVQAESDGTRLPVYIQLTGLDWPGATYDATHQAYRLEPTSDDITLSFTTTDDSGDVAVRLFSDDESYEPVDLLPWHFTNVGFIDAHAMPSNPDNQWGSNVVFGLVNRDDGKNVLLGYHTDPDKPTPVINFADKAGLTFNNNNAYDLAAKKSTLHPSTYAGQEDFYWAEMKTVGGSTDVSVTLRSNGYVEETVTAGRFQGNMLSSRVPASNLKSWFTSSSIHTGINLTQCNASIEFDQKPQVSDNGLILENGKTYKMTVRFYKNYVSGVPTEAPGCELVSVQLQYLSQDKIPQTHLNYAIESPEESTFYPYQGNYGEYIWTFPRGCKEGTIELQAPNNRDAVINVLRIWGFKASN